MILRLEEDLQTANPTVAWGMAVTEMAAAAVRCSNNDAVAKRHVHCREGVRQQKTEDGH
jgi:hypothetical protein